MLILIIEYLKKSYLPAIHERVCSIHWLAVVKSCNQPIPSDMDDGSIEEIPVERKLFVASLLDLSFGDEHNENE